MMYVHIASGSDGESYMEDCSLDCILTDFAPPAPPILLSSAFPAERAIFGIIPAGWEGGWHPAPARQWAFVLAGEAEIETADGVVRRFGSGSRFLLEDTTGRGHKTTVIGDDDLIAG